MFEDFWIGYNYGKRPQQQPNRMAIVAQQPISFQYSGKEVQQQVNEKLRQQSIPGVYDKSKFIKMQGPNGESGEIYATGKMYIMAGGGKAQVRTFPSRPVGIKHMQQRGWVLV